VLGTQQRCLLGLKFGKARGTYGYGRRLIDGDREAAHFAERFHGFRANPKTTVIVPPKTLSPVVAFVSPVRSKYLDWSRHAANG
jgi:hypothetical protein